MTRVISVLFGCMCTAASAQTITTSLNACYALDGNGTEVINSLTGAVTVATPTVDRFNNAGSALRFNGNASCFVKLPNHPLLKPANALSFALWVRPEVVNQGAHIVFTKNNQVSNFEAYQLCIYSGSPVFRLNKASATQNNIVLSAMTLTPSIWYHVVCVIDNTSLSLYVNGVLHGSTPSTFSGYDYASSKNVYVGASNESFTIPFVGSMDNLRFWDRTLTSQEVAQLYQNDPVCGAAVQPVPLSYFVSQTNTVCAGSAITFSDASSNAPTSWNWLVSGGGTYSSTATSPSFTFAAPGIYTISLTASNASGPGNTAVTTVTVNPVPVIAAVSSTNEVCLGSSANLAAAGATSYTWSTSQNGTPIQVFPTANTVYNVIGSTAGCYGTASLTVNVKPVPTILAIASSTLVCKGASLTISATGASTLTWSTLQTGASIVVNPFVNSTYVVSGTNSVNCTSNATVAVQVKLCNETGVEEFNTGSTFVTYPNPVSEILNVKGKDGTSFVLMDFIGEKVMEFTLSGSGELSVDMTNVATGIFFLVEKGSLSRPVKIVKD